MHERLQLTHLKISRDSRLRLCVPSIKYLFIFLATFGLMACATKPAVPSSQLESPKTDTPRASTSENSENDQSITPFKELSYPARMQYMRDVITPELKRSFQKHNRRAYRRFGCSSCHGRGARMGDYSMPSPSLMPLHAGKEMQSDRAHDPKMFAFMEKIVVPQMAHLLGRDTQSSEEPAYGCFECHQKK